MFSNAIPPTLGYPVEFLLPYVDIRLAKRYKQREILRIAYRGVPRNRCRSAPVPRKGKAVPTPSGSGSKGSVSNVEASYSTPSWCIQGNLCCISGERNPSAFHRRRKSPDVSRFVGELFLGSVQFSVVFQAVHAHLEAVGRRIASRSCSGHHVIALWNEVKRGIGNPFLVFQLHQPVRPGSALWRLQRRESIPTQTVFRSGQPGHPGEEWPPARRVDRPAVPVGLPSATRPSLVAAPGAGARVYRVSGNSRLSFSIGGLRDPNILAYVRFYEMGSVEQSSFRVSVHDISDTMRQDPLWKLCKAISKTRTGYFFRG